MKLCTNIHTYVTIAEKASKVRGQSLRSPFRQRDIVRCPSGGGIDIDSVFSLLYFVFAANDMVNVRRFRVFFKHVVLLQCQTYNDNTIKLCCN